MTRSHPLPIVLLGTFLLGLLFIFTIPYGYGPDEPSHFGYVRSLAQGNGFPVLGESSDPLGPAYEAHQPPLYYLSSLPAYFIGRGIGGEGGAWLAVRFFSLLCGLGTAALVTLLVLRLFPEEPEVAGAAGAFAGWLPSQAALFSVVNNDPLTQFGFTLTLYLLVRHLLNERPRRWDGLWIGLAAGLTFMVKSSALILLVVVPIILLVRARSLKGDTFPLRSFGGFCVGALVCVPWLLRNQSLYGDPLGWGAFLNYFMNVHHSPTPHILAEKMRVAYTPTWYWLQAVGVWAYRDSLGMWLFSRLGSPVPIRVALPPELYSLWGILWAGAFGGFVRFAYVESKQRSKVWWWSIAAMLLVLSLTLVAYLRLNAVFFWAHSRYVFPAVGALALLWSVGLSRLVPPRYRAYFLWGVSGLLFLIALFAGFAVLGGYFDAAQPR